jgi:Fungal specific transcription factor domain
MPFTFVDAGASDDRDNRRKIRKHLSVFHALQRRQRDVQKQKNAAELRSRTVVAAGPLSWRHKNKDEAEAPESDNGSTSSSVIRTPSSLGRDTSVHIDDGLRFPVKLIDCTSNPSSILGAGRKDPFKTYPIPWNTELDESVDFFVNGLGPYLYGYTPNEAVDVFRHHGFVIAAQDPAAFHTNMLLASIHLDLINSRTLPGMRALRHRVEAIRLINERLGKPIEMMEQSTIYTIIALTCLQYVWGAVGSAEVHDGGLQRLLIKCGGLKALRRYPLLEHTLYSVALVTPRMLSFASPDLYSEDEIHWTPEEERRAVSRELLELLHSIKSREQSWPIAMLAFAFKPGSPLQNLLVSPTSDVIPSAASHTIEAAERSRLSILLHFHCILMRLPEHAEIIKWARKLNKLIRDAWIWQNSLTMVQYMIVQAEDSIGLEDPDLAWQVIRLVEVSALLPRDTYIKMKDYMFALLSQSMSPPKLDLQSIKRDLGI